MMISRFTVLFLCILVLLQYAESRRKSKGNRTGKCLRAYLCDCGPKNIDQLQSDFNILSPETLEKLQPVWDKCETAGDQSLDFSNLINYKDVVCPIDVEKSSDCFEKVYDFLRKMSEEENADENIGPFIKESSILIQTCNEENGGCYVDPE